MGRWHCDNPSFALSFGASVTWPEPWIGHSGNGHHPSEFRAFLINPAVQAALDIACRIEASTPRRGLGEPFQDFLERRDRKLRGRFARRNAFSRPVKLKYSDARQPRLDRHVRRI